MFWIIMLSVIGTLLVMLGCQTFFDIIDKQGIRDSLAVIVLLPFLVCGIIVIFFIKLGEVGK